MDSAGKKIGLWMSLLLMALSLLIKIYGGISYNSTALLADGFDSLINLVSMSTAVYLTFYSTKPADEQHPYGHYGFSALSTMITGVIMITVGTLIILESYNGLIRNEIIQYGALHYSAASTIVLVVSVFLYSISIEKTMAIRAEVRHLLTDITESIVVLVGVGLSIYTFPVIDKLLALGIAGLFYYGGIKNLNEVKPIIVHESPDKSIINKLRLCLEKENVKIKQIRVRKVGDKLFADAIIELNPHLTLYQAHIISDKLEQKAKECMENIAEIIIHSEPEE